MQKRCKMQEQSSFSSINEFFAGREIFITGGSGFMGKVLVEKLLRSCKKIKTIFILIRPKKGKSLSERLRDITDAPLFDVIKAEDSTLLEKLVPVKGDVTELNLGLSDEDIELIKNTSVIFHVAASVRFDDPLKYSILMNTRGTRELVKIAQGMKNLAVFLHVSTTYCNPDKHVIYEKLYPPYANWDVAIKLAEKCDVETLNILNAKYSGYQPNTYTFTKSLSEHIINDYKDEIPVVIFRPSIVISSINDPIPGWIDSFNGPVSMLLASGIGILRTMYGDPNVVSDYIPVDIAIKGMIIAAYERGRKPPEEKLPIYNCSTSSLRSVTTGFILDLAKDLIEAKPLEKMLWVPGGSITTSRMYNYIRFMLFHVLIACIVDTVFRLTNQKPFLLRLQRRIYAANLALHYFAITHWVFVNKKLINLEKIIPEHERKDWSYLYLKDIDLKEYFMNSIMGARKYLLKEPEDAVERAKVKFRRIYVIDKILRFSFIAIVLYVLYQKFCVRYFPLGL